MNNDSKLAPTKVAVRNIFEVQGDYARVSVDNETFNAIRGMTPSLPYTTSRNASGQGIRIFNIGGVVLMSRYDKETRKTNFIMKNTDAVANLQTLAQERANEPVLGFTL